MTAEEIIQMANSLGDNLSDEQADSLLDAARASCSLSEIERIRDALDGGLLFTAITMMEGEMGGFQRY